MSIAHAVMSTPAPRSEPVRSYNPESSEREALLTALRERAAEQVEMPLVIRGRKILTGDLEAAIVPHDHRRTLGHAHVAGQAHVRAAIAAAKEASHDWSRLAWSERAAVFLRAADMLSGPWRDRLNAATMLGQSKTVHQAEIDSAAELADFWRLNVTFMHRLYQEQPISPEGVWNQIDYRPLEGFILALTPFNFTAIAGNLPSAPALMGNTVVWKPATTAKPAAHLIMELLQHAGLPDGVINLIYGDGPGIADIALDDPDFAGLHFTGSTVAFNSLWRKIAGNTERYRSYPRVVGETGGKNFVLAHPSADLAALATAVIRGGYEYQGQKCSAASRVFVPQSLWPGLRQRLADDIASIRVGDVADFSNFMGAVIDRRAWTRHANAIQEARQGTGGEIVAGGKATDTDGFFIHPTLIHTSDLTARVMTEELFGPIVAVFVYPDSDYEEMAKTIDRESRYGLTGAIFSSDRRAIAQASDLLRGAAGNFYINDKPTGAVVGQQPFGGGRASGTNDKAGSLWNLIRWVSPRAIKETFAPPTDYRYPFMA